ncbi:hypothetical protein NL676_011751 [Syzygium grande]|nr:hypothetical protein NL676_011751 [Syzygium grande]
MATSRADSHKAEVTRQRRRGEVETTRRRSRDRAVGNETKRSGGHKASGVDSYEAEPTTMSGAHDDVAELIATRGQVVRFSMETQANRRFLGGSKEHKRR